MKKLSIMFGIALILALISGNASAVSFGLDIGADGTIDDPAEVTIFLSETIDIDIYLVDWASLGNPGQALGALDYQFTWDATKVAVAGIVLKDLKPNGSALWDAEGQYPNGNYVDLSVIEYGVGVSGTPIRLHTITLHCIAIGDAAIGVGNAYAADTLGDDTTLVDPAAGVIHQIGLECGCEITPDSATLGDNGTQQFNASQVNPGVCNPSDYQWSDDCTGGDVDASGLFTANATVVNETCTVTVVDSGNPSVECVSEVTLEETPDCTIELEIEAVKAAPSDTSVQVPVIMKNPSDKVVAIETVIMDEGNSLTCAGCTATDRAPGFMCFATEQAFGECKVILIDPSDSSNAILEGDGPVLTIDYTVACEIAEDCIDLKLQDTIVSDENQDPVNVCEIEETDDDICFITCGDVAPGCGDGFVNIFDILEEIDFVLGITEPSLCQAEQANVPTSLPIPPDYCDAPDDDINIFDVLVIIDKALGKDNCCDYYYFLQ